MQVKPDGPLDMDTCGELIQQLSKQLSAEETLTLDLSACSPCDSAGLALLFELQRQAMTRKARLIVSGLPDNLRSLARLYAVESLLTSPEEQVS